MTRKALLLVFLGALLATSAIADRGPVSHRVSGCDWFLVDLPTGYVLMEWYGGSDPSKYEELVGEMETYGFKSLFNVNSDQELRVWIDDFMLSKSNALEKLYEKCE